MQYERSAKDEQLLVERIDARRALAHLGPQVGDFVIYPNGHPKGYQERNQGPHEERVAHDWGNGLVQTGEGGSIYLGKGYASWSGSLNPGIDAGRLIDTGESRQGGFWFFHDNYAGAGRGIGVKAPCKVYTYEEE